MVFEMAGDHEAVAAVISSPRADHDASADAKTHQQLGRTAPRILHEHDAGHPQFVDGSTIDIADFIPTE